MALSGQQIKQIQSALLDGFPSKAHLEMMTRIELDSHLDAIAEADDQTLRIYKLIMWAERTGNVRALIDGAVSQNSGNPTLKKLSQQSAAWELDLPAPAPQPDARPTIQSSAASKELTSALNAYLDHLFTRYQFLDFKGMGMSDRVSLQLPLTQMYVPLKARLSLPDGETWARELRLAGRTPTEEEAAAMGERLSEPQAVLDLLNQYDGLIILGDPGAGKTTFLKYLTLMLALNEGAELGMADRLPVLVPLSAYANALAQQDVSLQEFMGEYYRSRGVDLPVNQLIDQALAAGRGLIMLDGLDEVQALTQRALVVERVETFFDYQRKRGNKFLITSRIVGYRQVRPAADGLMECTLVDFDDDDIVLFLEKWTQAIEQATKGDSTVTKLEAAEEKAELLFALERNPGVRQLAANPLLLTILALMKRQGILLPERRVQLYEQYVQTLIRHWNLSRGLDRRVSRDLDVLATTRVLAPLALWMHETSPGVGLVKAKAVEEELRAIYTNRNEDDPEAAAQQMLTDAREHASLLLERGAGEYGFIHLTFQEYLAAVAIAQRGQSDIGPIVDLLAEHVDDASWHEVSLLTVGYMGIIQQRDEAAGEVLMQLIERGPGEAGVAAAFAGEAVLDGWPGGVTARCRSTVIDALHETMTASATVAAPVRARAGSVLGALGDPRDLEELVPIPAGTFLMGEGEEQHKVHADAFLIGKYPVTNGQYAEFVTATGYEPPSHWRGKKPLPEILNHPVTYVSWHDARAYCAWLSELRGEAVRLPTEAEWEKAARGTDGRRYPWGDGADSNRANYRDTRIRETSPVGCFPTGESPYGCLDMAGNVWEWTNSLRKAYPYDPNDGREDAEGGGSRTLRGGSWFDSGNGVRCAYRFFGDPNFRNFGVGFRVVSPGAVDL